MRVVRPVTLELMSVYESVLMFVIATLLVTVAAIHGFVLVMTYFDKRRKEKRREEKSGNLNG